MRPLLLLAFVLPACAPVGEEGPPVTEVTASGNAFDFDHDGGRVEGGEVGILELPDRTTTTDAEGFWSFDGLPVGAQVTFTMEIEGRPPIQTATFTLGTEDLERVTFQSPDDGMFDLLSSLLGLDADPGRCQIASTVTRRGHSVYDGSGTHGEPQATVALAPAEGAAEGPVYFNLSEANLIWPDRNLDETTEDGGVLFLDVEPGVYELSAQKVNATIRPVTLTCRAGWLVNASPPWGLQVVAGGLEPRPE